MGILKFISHIFVFNSQIASVIIVHNAVLHLYQIDDIIFKAGA